MTLLRIDLMSQEAEISITSAERVYKVPGNDHISLELAKPGDTITITLVKAAAGADKYRGVPLNDQDEFKPLPPSHLAGIYTVGHDGSEIFQGKAKQVETKRRRK